MDDDVGGVAVHAGEDAAVAFLVEGFDVVHHIIFHGDFFGGDFGLVFAGRAGGVHGDGFEIDSLIDVAVAEADPFDAGL